MSAVSDVLERVERGEATASDAELLRQQLGLQMLARVRQNGDGESSRRLQERVMEQIRRHHIADGWNDSQLAARMAFWSVIEMAHMFQWVDLPTSRTIQMGRGMTYTPGAVMVLLANKGLSLFQTYELWLDSGIDLDVSRLRWSEYLAAAAEPLLALAELLGIDLAAAVCEKVNTKASIDVR